MTSSLSTDVYRPACLVPDVDEQNRRTQGRQTRSIDGVLSSIFRSFPTLPPTSVVRRTFQQFMVSENCIWMNGIVEAVGTVARLIDQGRQLQPGQDDADGAAFIWGQSPPV